nr:hypothetical protein [uncultured Albidiferax sp.]
MLMIAWLKRSALVLLVFVAVWVLMLVYWTSMHRLPTTSEIFLYMLLLPAGFLLGIWLVRKAGALLAASWAAQAARAQAPLAAEAPALVPDVSHERAWTLAVLATALRAPHGDSADALAAALQSGEARLGLDPELKANGFPVKVGRVPGVDGAACAERLDAWQAAAGKPVGMWSEEQLRALAMAHDVLLEVAPLLTQHPLLAAYASASQDQRNTIALPTLQLLAVWPSRWTLAERQTASLWLTHLLEEQGWPAEKMLPSPLGSSGTVEPLALIDSVSVHSHRQDIPCLCLVLASESFVGEESVDLWEQAGQLRRDKADGGQTPGEGAVCLLLGDTQQAQHMADLAPASLHRAALGRRDKSADATGRIGGALLEQLVQHALQAAGVEHAQVNWLVADSDHRRLPELMVLEQTVFPDLDMKKQCLKIAADCGSAGAVSALTALAVAHFEATANAACVVCVGSQDAFDRAAVVVRPWAAEAGSA